MLYTGVLSLLAGVLTVLAPCVLPFLPVIVGGSLGGDRRRPWIIAGSLVVSLMAFTLLLKASTALIGIDPRVWTAVSGGLVIALGLFMLFPGLWAWISERIKLGEGSHALLEKATGKRKGVGSAVLTGVALGPVFSSCSPTYAYVIASVLPASLSWGLVYLALYCVGLTAALLAISLLGRKLIERIKWAADPRGWFQRAVAVLFILVGVLVASGLDKRFQAWAVNAFPSLAQVESDALPDSMPIPRDPAPQGETTAYQAPEITGIQEWINSSPTTLEQLRGKVVLVDFWTYSCVNCIRTQPYLNAWYERYQKDGFEILGVHAPEFAFEKVPDNVRRAVTEAGIKYPVALDNDFATWRAYGNRYWPAKYLVNKEGKIVFTHFGEGGYDEMEAKIRELLGAQGPMVTAKPDGTAQQGQSPETYLGTSRAAGYAGTPDLHPQSFEYSHPEDLASNQWSLSGQWQVDEESITALSDGASLRYRFDGRELYLVMGGPEGAQVQVKVNGEAMNLGPDAEGGTASASENRLYRLVKLPEFAKGTLVELTFSKGVRANAFTFGG